MSPVPANITTALSLKVKVPLGKLAAFKGEVCVAKDPLSEVVEAMRKMLPIRRVIPVFDQTYEAEAVYDIQAVELVDHRYVQWTMSPRAQSDESGGLERAVV